MIIGLGHTARVGKDTCAGLLIEHHGYARVAFADALKDFVYAIDSDVRLAVNLFGWEDAKANPANRRKLVDIGNSARGIIGADVWIRAALARVTSGRTVITDVRYPNEVEAVRSIGGVVVKVERPGFEPLPNVADQALADFDEWDAVICNDGTVEDLARKVDGLIAASRRRNSWGGGRT